MIGAAASSGLLAVLAYGYRPGLLAVWARYSAAVKHYSA